ncbi:MAG: trypsin-like peptidase domain-containing protein [Planctomycetes bacterium]|nr:trypsin-like peptidase domain-containing protein [Planctomycetota bacterium]
MVAVQMVLLSLALASPGQPVLLDFTASWCGPCRQMQPAIQQLQAAGYPVQAIDVDAQKDLAKQFNVTGVPCFVLVVDGREVQRVVGATTADKLIAMFTAAGARQPQPAQRQLTAATGPAIPHVQSPNVDAAVNSSAPANMPATPYVNCVPPVPSNATDGMVDRLTAASVRLRINDASGHSVGSGTIIDTQSGEALIVTCGHVFRESQGKGKIEVDLLAPGAPQKLPARLIGYSIEPDIALLSIRPGCGVQPARVAPRDYTIAKDDPVVSIGCDHGGPSSARLTRVTAINKYLGADNLQTAGQPVQGRSGGGLFTAEGLLIGVCNAADPKDNEGLFASLKVIHAELAKHELDRVIAGAGAADKTVAPVPFDTITTPVAAVPATQPASLQSGEQVLLEQLSAKSEGAELICIVRSLNDPRAKSEIIVLDRASPELLEKLAVERRLQPSQQPTSARR